MKKDKDKEPAEQTSTQEDTTVQSPSEEIPAASSAIAETSSVNLTSYATEYFKRNKIPYCLTCGAQHQNTPQGEPVCAESRTDCPRLGGK